MNFAKWMEEQGQLPDARQFSYIACVLYKGSQDNLKRAAETWYSETFGTAFPNDWIWKCHHMTVKPPGVQTSDLVKYQHLFGVDVKLTITGMAVDNIAFAAEVKPDIRFDIQPPVAHITIAHSRNASPKDSNQLLAYRAGIKPAKPLMLESIFAAVKRDQRSIYPEKPLEVLAVPTLIS